MFVCVKSYHIQGLYLLREKKTTNLVLDNPPPPLSRQWPFKMGFFSRTVIFVLSAVEPSNYQISKKKATNKTNPISESCLRPLCPEHTALYCGEAKGGYLEAQVILCIRQNQMNTLENVDSRICVQKHFKPVSGSSCTAGPQVDKTTAIQLLEHY